MSRKTVSVKDITACRIHNLIQKSGPLFQICWKSFLIQQWALNVSSSFFRPVFVSFHLHDYLIFKASQTPAQL
ncbi:hypothetical protein L6452_13034 [Arctium lappa]|uniref:Uncharacterized protein n=1 Tax=Arctium lappa TaxID=4217 RepID=A0ACB9CH70_ARCLA|nr:hypothetical protein L6452_13034 [Arctium lappa]